VTGRVRAPGRPVTGGLAEEVRSGGGGIARNGRTRAGAQALQAQPAAATAGLAVGTGNPATPWPSSAMLGTVTAGEPAPARDPHRPARLLQAERDALLPILHRTPDHAFGRPTACPGWSVRDVLAHCAAALSRVAAGNLHAFTPALNELDVAERREWPLTGILAELSAGYQEAGKAITGAGGKLDVIALGEWLHGGDVRDALGEPLAYASDGFDDACALLCDWTRHKAIPLVRAQVPGSTLTLGVARPGRLPAALHATRPAMMRLFAGRPADPSDYRLAGATAAELIVF